MLVPMLMPTAQPIATRYSSGSTHDGPMTKSTTASNDRAMARMTGGRSEEAGLSFLATAVTPSPNSSATATAAASMARSSAEA